MLTALILSVAVMAWTPGSASIGAPPDAGVQYAYNKQNPRPATREGFPTPSQQVKPRFHKRPPDAVAARRQHRAASPVFDQRVVVGLAALVAIAIAGQWLIASLNVPSGFLVLAAAAVVGPLTGAINTNAVFGAPLLPLLALVLAVIVFEQASRLRFAELQVIRRLILRLVSIGLLVTWLVGTVAARVLLGLDWPTAVLLGVIIAAAAPNTRFSLMKPQVRSEVGSILEYEGMALDVLGTLLIVSITEALLFGSTSYAHDAPVVVVSVLWVGSVAGLLAALALFFILKNNWIPTLLRTTAPLAIVVAVFSIANAFQVDAGFVAVIVMGLALANQKALRLDFDAANTLLLSAVLILLATRVQLTDLAHVGLGGAAFLFLATLVVRPLAVAFSTARLGLGWGERLSLSWIAPRGIVAAGVGTICALRLAAAGMAPATHVPPIILLFVPATLLLDAVSVARAAQWLGLATPDAPLSGAGAVSPQDGVSREPAPL